MRLLSSNNTPPLFKIIRYSVFHCLVSTKAAFRTPIKSGLQKRDNIFRKHKKSDMWQKRFYSLALSLSTDSQSEWIPSGSTSTILLRKLELALKDHDMEDAIDIFDDYKRLYGFPGHYLVGRLITGLCYSCNHQWLLRASELVLILLQQKPYLLRQDVLARLVLSLARTQMPVHASKVLWNMLEKGLLPPLNVSSLITHHMVKSDIGLLTMTNYLIEVYNHIQNQNRGRRVYAELTGIDTLSFNLVLDACVKFGLSFKGLHMIELMAQIGIVADANSIIIISRIYEMNGLRDELNKFKTLIDQIPKSLLSHYQPFYDSLLSLHFKFNDVDAVVGFMAEICEYKKCSLSSEVNSQRCFVPIGSHHLQKGLKIEAQPQNFQKGFVLKLVTEQDLVIFKDRKLVPTKRALAKLIDMCKNTQKISEVSKLIIKMQNEMFSVEEGNLICEVIDACIHSGWPEVAHDILDDAEAQSVPIEYISYASLLTAYTKGQMHKEASSMVHQMERAGFPTIGCVLEVTKQSVLTDNLLMELKSENKWISPTIYELNSSIFYFFKAKMIKDALKIYRKMQYGAAVRPTRQTFINILGGYSSLGMYREITILWGDMKRKVDSENLLINSDLYEFLLLKFLRGGYFERVMEIIGHMKKYDVHVDKCMFKREFLKFHKVLYKNLKSSNAQSETQLKRLGFVRAFQKWVSID